MSTIVQLLEDTEVRPRVLTEWCCKAEARLWSIQNFGELNWCKLELRRIPIP
jgi:hypothetical protein